MSNLPIIQVSEKTLPQAWEKAILSLYTYGVNIKTDYDRFINDFITNLQSLIK
jgi:hypothetical protein